MDLEANAVAERELEALVGVFARPCAQRLVAGGLEDVAGQRVQPAAGDARPDRVAGRHVGLTGQGVELQRLGVGLADDERPGHVGPAAGLLVARPKVDVDREVGG